MKVIPYTLISTVLLLLLAACSASSQSSHANDSKDKEPSLKVVNLYDSTQCGTAVTTQWISNQETFATVFRAARQQMIFPASSQPPSIDFARYGVVLVSMGQQRTGGYAVELAQEELAVGHDTAQIAIRWREPEPGMIVTQALTHPCVFLQVPRANYHSVRVVDQNNQVRAEFSIN